MIKLGNKLKKIHSSSIVKESDTNTIKEGYKFVNCCLNEIEYICGYLLVQELSDCIKKTFEVFKELCQINDGFMVKNLIQAKQQLDQEYESINIERKRLERALEENEKSIEYIGINKEMTKHERDKDYAIKKAVYDFFDRLNQRQNLKSIDLHDDEQQKDLEATIKRKFEEKVQKCMNALESPHDEYLEFMYEPDVITEVARRAYTDINT